MLSASSAHVLPSARRDFCNSFECWALFLLIFASVFIVISACASAVDRNFCLCSSILFNVKHLKWAIWKYSKITVHKKFGNFEWQAIWLVYCFTTSQLNENEQNSDRWNQVLSARSAFPGRSEPQFPVKLFRSPRSGFSTELAAKHERFDHYVDGQIFHVLLRAQRKNPLLGDLNSFPGNWGSVLPGKALWTTRNGFSPFVIELSTWTTSVQRN